MIIVIKLRLGLWKFIQSNWCNYKLEYYLCEWSKGGIQSIPRGLREWILILSVRTRPRTEWRSICLHPRQRTIPKDCSCHPTVFIQTGGLLVLCVSRVFLAIFLKTLSGFLDCSTTYMHHIIPVTSNYDPPAAQHNDHSQMYHSRNIIACHEQTTTNIYTSIINELITIRMIEQKG